MIEHHGFRRWGGLASIAVAVFGIVGLAMYFAGSGLPESTDDVAVVANKVVSASLALAGAWLLILTMVFLLVFAAFLQARWGRDAGFMQAGAVLLGSAGIVHIVENILVVGLYSALAEGGRSPALQALWVSIWSCSVLAFGLIGAGTLGVAISFLRELGGPKWLGWWGMVTALLELSASLSLVFPAVSFLAAPSGVSFMTWCVAIGVWATAQRSQARILPSSEAAMQPAE